MFNEIVSTQAIVRRLAWFILLSSQIYCRYQRRDEFFGSYEGIALRFVENLPKPLSVPKGKLRQWPVPVSHFKVF